MPDNNHRSGLKDGVLVGLAAAVTGTIILLVGGLLSGRGLEILADAGMGVLPSAVRGATGVSATAGYLLSHFVLYLIAGIVGVAATRLIDRFPPFATALLLIIIIMEFGFLMLTTDSQASGRFTQGTWGALEIAHVIADVVLALGIIRVHPSLKQAWVRGYEGET